jgi:hypothetical protein
VRLESHQLKLTNKPLEVADLPVLRVDVQFQHIADGYQAHEAVLVEHRHVAEFSFCHALHEAADGIVHVARGNITGHDLRNRSLQTSASDFRHRAYDVALRQDAHDPSVRVADHQRTYVVRGEQLRCRSNVGARFDADDPATLTEEGLAACGFTGEGGGHPPVAAIDCIELRPCRRLFAPDLQFAKEKPGRVHPTRPAQGFATVLHHEVPP